MKTGNQYRNEVRKGMEDGMLRSMEDVLGFLAKSVEDEVAGKILNGNLSTEEEVATEILEEASVSTDVFPHDKQFSAFRSIVGRVGASRLYSLINSKVTVAYMDKISDHSTSAVG